MPRSTGNTNSGTRELTLKKVALFFFLVWCDHTLETNFVGLKIEYLFVCLFVCLFFFPRKGFLDL